MLSRNHSDRIRIAFDDHRLVNNAGLSCRPPWPSISACPNWLTCASTWAAPQAEPTPTIR